MNKPATRDSGAAAARGIAFNLAGQLIPLCVALVAMPVVMERLGPARFGVLALAWAVLTYFSLLDFGLSRALTKYAADAVFRGDRVRTNALAWTAVILQLLLSAVLAGLLLIAAERIPHFLRMDESAAREATDSFRWLAAALPFVLIFNTARALLEAAQRFALVNAVRIIAGSANFVVPLVGVLLGWTLPVIVFALVVVRALTALAQLALCKTAVPGAFDAPTLSLSEASLLLRFGTAVTVSSVISPVLVYLDRFALGSIVSVAAVGYYSAPSEVVLRLLVIPGSFALALYPLLSLEDAEGAATARRMTESSLRYIWLILAPLIAGMLVFADSLLNFWAGPELAAQASDALRLLLVGTMASSFAQLPLTELHAKGRPDLPAKFHVAELICYVPLVWLFVAWWGITGAALAWTLRVIADAVLLFAGARRVTAGTPAARAPVAVGQPIAALAVLAIAFALADRLPVAGVVKLLCVAALTALWLALTWHTLFRAEDRQLFALITGRATEGKNH